jgi:preprotein translocase subunit SecA
MYSKLSGMTGTADTEAQEFHDIYSLDVVSIPTNVPVTRGDHADLMFLTAKDKWQFIVDEIKAFHDVGRPILVGTTSVEKSETLSQMLTRKHGIKHEVLNAKPENIEREANIVESAGQLGMVMIATNMAGRGTDIKLGSITREQLLDHWLRRGIASRGLTVEATEEQLRENIYRKIAPRELEIPKREAEELPFDELEMRLLRHWARAHTMMTDKKIETAGAEELRRALDATGRILLHRIRWFENVEDLGGLHVIGTERHESRRIDNQLRGRSGRQGDNGSSRFFVCCDDDLMKMFAGETLMKVLPRLGFKEGDFIDSKMLSKRIEGAQRKVEERNFQNRKNILEYDEVMEHQRQAFYGMRQRVLEGRDVKGLIFDFLTEAVSDAVNDYLSPLYAARCAAEHANTVLDAQVVPERLVGREYGEMIDRIRKDAAEDARNAISVTIGEYMPTSGSEVEVEFDVAGLAGWARDQFGVELDIAELREKGPAERKKLEDRLAQAATEKIEAADLSGIREFVAPEYGLSKLAEWIERKFGIALTAEELTAAQDDGGVSGVEKLIVKRAEELYLKREIEYPVEFAMDMAMAMMRQNPVQGAEYIVRWANQRFNMGWTLESLRTIPPQEARQQLNDASRKFVEENAIGKAMDEAAAICMDDDALAAFFKERLGASEVPFEIRRLTDPEDREQAVRSRVESVMRAELLYFERTMLLEVLDGIWKDHLYAMDQLRGSISFRAVSQQDPRIEYKREGSRLFSNMHEAIRDKISDYVFKLKLTPRLPGGMPPRGGPAPGRAAPARPVVAGSPGTSADMYPAPATPVPGVISGPSVESPAPVHAQAAAPRALPAVPPVPASPPPGAMLAGAAGEIASMPDAAAPASEARQRDLEAANRAGSGGGDGARKQPVVRSTKRVGRNDPCPCGSGKKYKKCCGAPSNAATAD